MWKTCIGLVVGLCAGVLGHPSNLRAQGFALQLGPPVAAMPNPLSNTVEKKAGKDVVFVVRSTGCANPASVSYSGTVVSGVAGTRRTSALAIGPLGSSGVVGAVKNWAEKAPWVAAVAATCGASNAGAVVRITNDTYRREAVELLPRHPDAADIDRALALLASDSAILLSR